MSTICESCAKIRRGECYGEKDQTACPGYQPVQGEEEQAALDLDSFGTIMDDFLRKSNVHMLITMPEGTMEVTLADSLQLGGVVQFYLLLNAIPAAIKNTAEFWKGADAEKLASALAGLVEAEIKEAIIAAQKPQAEAQEGDAAHG